MAKKLEDLHISPMPWKVVKAANTNGTMATVRSNHLVMHDGHIEDARLIAVAPELYKALLNMTELFELNITEWNQSLRCALIDAKISLAKAAGEEVENG